MANRKTVKLAPLSSNSLVNAFFESSDHPLRDDLVRVRELVTTAVPDVQQAIKWNAPSFAIDGTFFATFHLQNVEAVQLVFHTGAKKRPDQRPVKLSAEADALVKWLDDARAMVTLDPKAAPQRRAFATLVREWVTQLA